MFEQGNDAVFSQCNVVRSPIKAQSRYTSNCELVLETTKFHNKMFVYYQNGWD